MDISSSNISFQARVGENALRIVNNEFGGKLERVKKFEQLFADTFVKNIDEGTIVDLDKNNNYVFSHTGFPKIKYKSEKRPYFKKTLAESLLQECSKVLGNIEYKMFRVIISKSIKYGKTFEELENEAQKLFKNEKSKNYFLENLNIAKRIKKEYPASQLKDYEFDYMNNLIMQVEADTPGTELYNLMHNFGGLSFE